MLKQGVKEDDEYLVQAVNIIRTFVVSLTAHMKGNNEYMDNLPLNSVFTEHQLQLLRSQVNAYQLLIVDKKLSPLSLAYLKRGTGKPPMELMNSPNNIVPQQHNPTLGQRLLCTVAHAPSRCKRIVENHPFIEREYKAQFAARNERQLKALEAARQAGKVVSEVQYTGKVSNKLMELQTTVRRQMIGAYKDDRSTKKMFKQVELVKKEKDKRHSKYLNEIKVQSVECVV